MQFKILWVQLYVNQTEHEHRQDRGLARASGEDRQDIDAIEYLRHCLNLIITWSMGPEVSKDLAYELPPLFRGERERVAFASHVASGG
jgi:hypothetical protein